MKSKKMLRSDFFLHDSYPVGIPQSASTRGAQVYRRPLPRPLPRPRPVLAAGFGTTDFFGVSSTSKASRFRLSGSIQARIVDPRTESVAYETGFFPRL